jgi:hypothetical protein
MAQYGQSKPEEVTAHGPTFSWESEPVAVPSAQDMPRAFDAVSAAMRSFTLPLEPDDVRAE